jgi:hypothetical protein
VFEIDEIDGIDEIDEIDEIAVGRGIAMRSAAVRALKLSAWLLGTLRIWNA